MCIAQCVRDNNAGIWAPDVAGEAAPEMLVDEPATRDTFETEDGRAWVRVYLDGSSLDQNGIVQTYAARAAAERRFELAA